MDVLRDNSLRPPKVGRCASFEDLNSGKTVMGVLIDNPLAAVHDVEVATDRKRQCFMDAV